jgi:transposase
MPVTNSQREILEGVARSGVAAHRDVQRARAMLLAANGVANTQIAATMGVSPTSVKAWRGRFAQDGLTAFGVIRPGRGRKPSIPAEKVEAIVHAMLHEKPPGETHWSCRSMAEAQGVSPATVQRIWSARSLKPHCVKTFKLSNLDRSFWILVACRRSPTERRCGRPKALSFASGGRRELWFALMRARIAQAAVSIALGWLGLSPAVARATPTCAGVRGPIAVWAHGVSCRFAVRFVDHVDTLQLYRHPTPYRYRGYRCSAYRRGVELYSHCVNGQRVIRFQTGP